ncbi:hypothetical protein D3C85_1714570 [compost metagenome]
MAADGGSSSRAASSRLRWFFIIVQPMKYRPAAHRRKTKFGIPGIIPSMAIRVPTMNITRGLMKSWPTIC